MIDRNTSNISVNSLADGKTNSEFDEEAEVVQLEAFNKISGHVYIRGITLPCVSTGGPTSATH